MLCLWQLESDVSAEGLELMKGTLAKATITCGGQVSSTPDTSPYLSTHELAQFAHT